MKQYMVENLCFSIVCGGLRAIAEAQPTRSKFQGGCQRLADKIHLRGNPKPNTYQQALKRLSQEEVDILKRCIAVSASFMDEINDGTEKNHIMLNLIVFCMEEIKRILHRADFDHMNRLFEMFDGSDCHADVMLGRRVYERLMAEITIELAMKENAA